MEFFHEPKIDWMGKKWYFILLSIPLLLAGLISMTVKHGLTYGIDFRGGTLVYVKFSKQPNPDAIRAQLDRQNLRNATLQQFGPAAEHQFIIGLDLRTTTSSGALDEGRRAIVNALSSLYGPAPPGKIDFNNASSQTIADHLLAADPLGLAPKGLDLATATYRSLAEGMVDYRNNPLRGGLIGDFQELRAVKGVAPQV